MNRLKRHFTAFLRDENGVILAEALILMPFLVWTFVAMFVYWDVFRTINAVQKAGYGIADLLSRQGIVQESYIANLEKVLNFLAPGSPNTEMRITSMYYDADVNKYFLYFSRSTSGLVPPLTNADLQVLKNNNRIPTMDHKDSVIIVETFVEFVPKLNTGVFNIAPMVTGKTFGDFIVTRPRNRYVCIATMANCV
jgi:hypothetical protein